MQKAKAWGECVVGLGLVALSLAIGYGAMAVLAERSMYMAGLN
jgi:hypothetical protein